VILTEHSIQSTMQPIHVYTHSRERVHFNGRKFSSLQEKEFSSAGESLLLQGKEFILEEKRESLFFQGKEFNKKENSLQQEKN
jgi:hypothetical protein